jgi:CheY-like chemotaxis protein
VSQETIQQEQQPQQQPRPLDELYRVLGEALRLLDVYRPDLIVTDLMMPLLMGETLIAFVRGRADLADIPIVVLTGFRAVFGDAAIAAGATEVLEKPVDVPRLLAAVKRLLGTQP